MASNSLQKEILQIGRTVSARIFFMAMGVMVQRCKQSLI